MRIWMLVGLLIFSGCTMLPPEEQDVFSYCFTDDPKGGEALNQTLVFGRQVVIRSIGEFTTDEKGCIELNKKDIVSPIGLIYTSFYRNDYIFSFSEPFRDFQLIIPKEERTDMFYLVDDPHWTHMPITYSIANADKCGSYEVNKIIRGFNDIEDSTEGVVSFKRVDEDGDISIRCAFIEDCYEYHVDVQENYVSKSERICAHDRGRAQITRLQGNKILNAEILMIGLAGFAETSYGKGSSGFYVGSCGHATTEIHEVLHTFGYGHEENPESIMYFQEDAMGYTIQESGACVGKRKSIDESIVKDLVEKYK